MRRSLQILTGGDLINVQWIGSVVIADSTEQQQEPNRRKGTSSWAQFESNIKFYGIRLRVRLAGLRQAAVVLCKLGPVIVITSANCKAVRISTFRAHYRCDFKTENQTRKSTVSNYNAPRFQNQNILKLFAETKQILSKLHQIF